ncbi:hypothetical protein LR48_Vigan07g263200 [Vigna angularis]|uniref:Uncharacterized protein n=1 Tax=Phaseolus angularis TaxID=3914 RepID=A0A0L9V1L4_PHAAN|nr:hypothetical protein LR48_Vigan07g263200 [Vigna angularis]
MLRICLHGGSVKKTVLGVRRPSATLAVICGAGGVLVRDVWACSGGVRRRRERAHAESEGEEGLDAATAGVLARGSWWSGLPRRQPVSFSDLRGFSSIKRKGGKREDLTPRPAATVVALGVAGDVMDQAEGLFAVVGLAGAAVCAQGRRPPSSGFLAERREGLVVVK